MSKRVEFDLGHLFPEHPAIQPRGPLPKQRLVFFYIAEGMVRDGGIVYQGGKGCAKTMCCAAVDIWAHQKWPGLRSAVGRESYPSLLTSTWDEYKQMLERIPQSAIKRVSAPSGNSMGTVEWSCGGLTYFISLSDSKTWESTNLGLASVDEGHLQNPEIVDLLTTRVRQDRMPRVCCIYTNPAGHNYIFRWAHPKSKERLYNWAWIESSMFENPALPPGYIARMEEKYPPGTPGHKRWVLGKSTALEGSVFGEIFYSDPDDLIHIVPAFDIPANWDCGRGLDWGVDNPCAVNWGAKDDEGNWWIYRGHTRNGRSATWHAKQINELEHGENIRWTPADPEIFRRIHPVEGRSGQFYSVADQFRKAGCRVTPANNDRKLGLDMMLDLMAVDRTKIHPCTLKLGSPRLFIMDVESNEPLVDCLERVQWRKPTRTGTADSPDDIAKKDDHQYDDLRYLVMDAPDTEARKPVRAPKRTARGSRGQMGYR